MSNYKSARSGKVVRSVALTRFMPCCVRMGLRVGFHVSLSSRDRTARLSWILQEFAFCVRVKSPTLEGMMHARCVMKSALIDDSETLALVSLDYVQESNEGCSS